MDPETLKTVLSFVLPSLFGALSAVIVALFVRRSNRESNNNGAATNDINEFNAITGALFKRVEELEKRAEKQDAKIADLQSKERQAVRDLATKDEEIRVIKIELGESRRVNGALARYLKKLIRTWPQGGNLPIPDEPLDLDNYAL